MPPIGKESKMRNKKNTYLDSISIMQKQQEDALKKMWARDKKRKTVEIRTK